MPMSKVAQAEFLRELEKIAVLDPPERHILRSLPWVLQTAGQGTTFGQAARRGLYALQALSREGHALLEEQDKILNVAGKMKQINAPKILRKVREEHARTVRSVVGREASQMARHMRGEGFSQNEVADWSSAVPFEPWAKDLREINRARQEMLTEGVPVRKFKTNLVKPRYRKLSKTAAVLLKQAIALRAADRRALKASAFAVSSTLARKSGDSPRPGERGKYPIPDESHARAALSMVSRYGSPQEQEAVRRAVARRFPQIIQKVRGGN